MSQEQENKISKAKYLLNLALPYMQTIVALDYMESYMRESWIKDACEFLGIEDNGRRHPAVIELERMRAEEDEHSR